MSGHEAARRRQTEGGRGGPVLAGRRGRRGRGRCAVGYVDHPVAVAAPMRAGVGVVGRVVRARPRRPRRPAHLHGWFTGSAPALVAGLDRLTLRCATGRLRVLSLPRSPAWPLRPRGLALTARLLSVQPDRIRRRRGMPGPVSVARAHSRRLQHQHGAHAMRCSDGRGGEDEGSRAASCAPGDQRASALLISVVASFVASNAVLLWDSVSSVCFVTCTNGLRAHGWAEDGQTRNA
jgi:hypothetical protein